MSSHQTTKRQGQKTKDAYTLSQAMEACIGQDQARSHWNICRDFLDLPIQVHDDSNRFYPTEVLPGSSFQYHQQGGEPAHGISWFEYKEFLSKKWKRRHSIVYQPQFFSFGYTRWPGNANDDNESMLDDVSVGQPLSPTRKTARSKVILCEFYETARRRRFSIPDVDDG